MMILGLLCAVGVAMVAYRIFKLASEIRVIMNVAVEDKGFQIRMPCLGPAERSRLNSEFWSIRILKIPATLTLIETILLAAALKILDRIAIVMVLAAVSQLVPILLAYGVQLWRHYRFGRFNLERFDPKHVVDRELALTVIYCSALMPPLTVLLYLGIFGR